MDRDPGDIKANGKDASSDTDEDARLDALLASLPPAPGIKHIDDDDDEDIAQARADIAAGRCYDHETVGRWLETWGKPGRKPFREWLASQHG